MVEQFLDTTAEKELIINGRELKYKGIFQADRLFASLNRALEERGYTKREKRSEELVTEKGRKTYLELRPYKIKSNYLALMLKIRIYLDKVQEARVQEAAGREDYSPLQLQQGDVNIYFDAWILTDWESRWSMSPFTFFLKGFINKFLYIFPLEAGARGELVGDTAYIYAKVKKFLLSYRPAEAKPVREEEIRRQMEKEITQEMKAGAE